MSDGKKGICWNCGEKREVNSCGVCEDCWEAFPFLHDGCGGGITTI